MLVDRHRVIREIDEGAQRHIMELIQLRVQPTEHPEWDAERADGIPDADEVDPRLVGVLLAERRGDVRFGTSVARSIAIEPERVVEQPVVVARDEAGVPNESGETA